MYRGFAFFILIVVVGWKAMAWNMIKNFCLYQVLFIKFYRQQVLNMFIQKRSFYRGVTNVKIVHGWANTFNLQRGEPATHFQREIM